MMSQGCFAEPGNWRRVDGSEDSRAPSETCAGASPAPLASRVIATLARVGNGPLHAEAILRIGAEILEPLFHKPPLGPIPDYLDPHGSVHGCVAEYEDRLEEQERWKVRELSRWLQGWAGSRWCIEGKFYELQAESGSDRFWLGEIDHRAEPPGATAGEGTGTETERLPGIL